MHEKSRVNGTGIGVIAVVLILCVLASLIVLFGRVVGYTDTEYVNVIPLTDNTAYAQGQSENTSGKEQLPSVTYSSGSNPQFVMEADAAIFKLSYDETGKITVIGVEGNTDKLIAPGTSNIYNFTLANTGNVALDYTMEMEAYVEGTDLWLPVNARVWDYTNRYLLGSPDDMPDVLELNTVHESAELAAGRYAEYFLEWEWPFERELDDGSLDDEYDTMLGNLAVNDDLELHIVIRTYAEYDENPENPDSGELPKTGQASYSTILIVVCAVSFSVLCATFIVNLNKKRKGYDAE